MNADTLERTTLRTRIAGLAADRATTNTVHGTKSGRTIGYAPPRRVPNYENDVMRLARDDGYALGHEAARRDQFGDRIDAFVWGLAIGAIIAALIILVAATA